MFGLGFQEIVLILIVALLLFGAARLPEIGRALGKALSEFKKGMHDIGGDDSKDKDQSQDSA